MKAIVLAIFLAAYATSSLAGETISGSPDLNWAVRIQKQVDAQASKTTDIQKQVNSLLASIQDTRIPTGTIVAFYGDKAPKGWMLCDGSDIPSDHKDLRQLVGERVPDLRSMFVKDLNNGQPSATGSTTTAQKVGFFNFIIKI
ncbi:MAG TPA: tail fiber protein [Gallionella sp.]|nr:tail fiber protein [Gallionella sp.]